jgi:hypothetical protein
MMKEATGRRADNAKQRGDDRVRRFPSQGGPRQQRPRRDPRTKPAKDAEERIQRDSQNVSSPPMVSRVLKTRNGEGRI